MVRTDFQQEIYQMGFEEAYDRYQGNRLSQAEAAVLLGISDRPFRRYLGRHDEDAARAFLKEFEKALLKQ